MDSLIIAAGYGSRIHSVSESKPLTMIAGKSLLELGIRQAKAAGASRIFVVTGHQAERVESALPDISFRLGIEIIAERLTDWSKPNGWSVLAGAARIASEGGSDFLLTMADHIFSASILCGLARVGSTDRGVTLGIDRRITSPWIDPEDATWVQTDGSGFITSVGKKIPRWNAVDCGAFLATPELPRAIEAAIAEGKSGGLGDGMQWLANRGRAATWDIGEAWWLDVDDPRAHTMAEADAPRYLPEIYG